MADDDFTPDDGELFQLGESGERCDGLGALIEENILDTSCRAKGLHDGVNLLETLAIIDSLKDTLASMNSLKDFDPTVHWIDWEDVKGGQPLHAACGALVHDGKHWKSLAHSPGELSGVTCPDCEALPEYGVKLLAEVDLGDGVRPKAKLDLPPTRAVKPSGITGVSSKASDGVYEPLELTSGLFDRLDAFMYGSKK